MIGFRVYITNWRTMNLCQVWITALTFSILILKSWCIQFLSLHLFKWQQQWNAQVQQSSPHTEKWCGMLFVCWRLHEGESRLCELEQGTYKPRSHDIYLLTSDFSITPDAPQDQLILFTEPSLLTILAWPGWQSSWSSLWRDGQMSCTLSRCEEGKELFVMIISLAGLTLILELGILCMPHCGNVYNSN